MTQLSEFMLNTGLRARNSAKILAVSPDSQKSKAIFKAAQWLRKDLNQILGANHQDIDAGQKRGLSDAMLDRLYLDATRVESMALGLESIAQLKDPVGEIIAQWPRPNGLKIERVRTPLGVIGVIYESRPNVTADAGALCLKAGNASILRGGSDSFHSSKTIHQCLVKGLESSELPMDAIQLVPTTDRDAVGQMLSGLNGNLDVLVPRGGKSLVARVQQESRVPVFAHLEGICHIFVEATADPDIAISVVANSKMRRPGICGAVETLLLDRKLPGKLAKDILKNLLDLDCEIRGDRSVIDLIPECKPATEDDWKTEYLAPILAVRMVDGLEGAIDHIDRYSSQHTESILTDRSEIAETFMLRVDSAIVLHNASTQFADGGEFGMGAEIGIATGKMHARGPVGVEQLTSFKYRVFGSGQVRPQ